MINIEKEAEEEEEALAYAQIQWVREKFLKVQQCNNGDHSKLKACSFYLNPR